MRNSKTCVLPFVCIALLLCTAVAENNREEGASQVSLVPTFHCMSIYWSPAQGGSERNVSVRFREAGEKQWRAGLPLRYNPVATLECRADYRGSLVNLKPATTYEVALTLDGTDLGAECSGTTWSEDFPVGSVVKVSSGKASLKVSQSGTPSGYVLYDRTGCTIDTGNQDDVGLAVDASYVILRGFTIRRVKQHGIRILSGHHIVIEDCDISQWGSEDDKGWGVDYQAGVFSKNKDLKAVVIQRCKIHHPSWDSNSWAEKHGSSTHPAGPQAIVLWESEGNHVFRYNECCSDQDHYFNDGLGAGENGSYRGFPGADSDIYGNYIANCWDDGIEAEGGDQNVRIWNNYIGDVLIPIANAPVSIGPLYVWRNVSGHCYSPPGSSWDMTHGPFMKMGFADGESWMTGHMYVFNNTVFQDNLGAGGLGDDDRIIKHCSARNNILHLRERDRWSVADNRAQEDNDFDYDLLSGAFPSGQEQHGIAGVPRYVPTAGFDPETRTGMFQLAADSKGAGAAAIIPNFCEAVNGGKPDMGAHERGLERMEFGLKARFIPVGTFTKPGHEPTNKPEAGDGK